MTHHLSAKQYASSFQQWKPFRFLAHSLNIHIIAKIKSLFLAGGIATDSKNKTEQYRQHTNIETLKAQYSTQEDYLASLDKIEK